MAKIPAWLLMAALCFFAIQHFEKRGYERRSAEVLKEQEEQTRLHAEQLAANIKDTQEREAKLKQSLVRSNEVARKTAQQLAQHLAGQEKTHLESIHAQHTQDEGQCPTSPTERPLLGAAVLDAHTVRLLNEARAGGDAQHGSTANGTDEESGAAAVTGTDFALNDLEVVRLYHELSARHNGLVDWVYQQCVDPALQPKQP
jgi:hypothetical protein